MVNEYLMITSVKGTTKPHFTASPQVTPGLWDLDINLDVFLSEDSQEGDCDPDQWEEEEWSNSYTTPKFSHKLYRGYNQLKIDLF